MLSSCSAVMKETFGCEEKSVTIDLIEFCHGVGMFCQHRNETGILTESTPG